MKSTLLLFCCGAALLNAAPRTLLPQPQRIHIGSGRLPLRGLSVVLASQATPEDTFAARRLTQGLAQHGNTPGPHKLRFIRTNRNDEPLPRGDSESTGADSREAYHIRITPTGGEVRAPSSAGLFYAAGTLLQLIENTALPEVEIDDWPSLAYRGVMVDFSHGPHITEEEIEHQIDFLARWKGNQYYFYSELSVELKGYPLINPEGRYTQDEVRHIIAYARERHVDVVPCLEFFGHLHDFFRIERYAHLSTLPHGSDFDPRNPEMQRIVADWIDQMTSLFESPWFHVGLDEPWEWARVGSGKTADAGQIFLEHLTRVAGEVRKHGKRVLFWADVTNGAAIFDRFPRLAANLPAGAIPVPWHYEDEKDFGPMLEPFRKAGIPQVVATGIRAYETIVPDFRLTFANIDGFLRDGRKAGVLGIINTSWSDDAQILHRMTRPAVAYGAIAAWEPKPVDRANFFRNYSSIEYSDAHAAAGVASALQSLDEAQQTIAAALETDNMFRLWDDPFAPATLARSRAHVGDLRKARLLAESAEEQIAASVVRYPETLASLLVGARLLDYAGMKFLYAVEIADNYAKLASPTRTDLYFWLGRQAGDRNHSRIGDLMDTISELREQYRTQWLAESTPYRLGTALGRFDAEFQGWRRLQAKLWEFRRTFKQGDPLPPLDSFREP